jgi:hypothetical protein
MTKNPICLFSNPRKVLDASRFSVNDTLPLIDVGISCLGVRDRSTIFRIRNTRVVLISSSGKTPSEPAAVIGKSVVGEGQI